MACGTPVIAFNKGSMPELIENGKNGFLVNTVSEAVAAVASVKDINRAYCHQHVEQYFTINRMVKEYIQVYEMILEKRKSKEYRK
jgi:glycosyltransferase involved in cell wall biosynthesis